MVPAYLKLYTKKYFVTNWEKEGYCFIGNIQYHLFMKTLRWKSDSEQILLFRIK